MRFDVSQDRLDVLLLPKATRFSVGNDEAGWNALSARLSGLPLAAIGLEPSGGYERGVIRALLTAGLSVRRINPNRLRQFARAGAARTFRSEASKAQQWACCHSACP
jgi:transposase